MNERLNSKLALIHNLFALAYSNYNLITVFQIYSKVLKPFFFLSNNNNVAFDSQND